MTDQLLLISDVDDTLLGKAAALRRFADFHARSQPTFAIVYASGRFYASQRKDILNEPMPEPAAVIGGVGTEIRSFPDGDLNKAWVDRISGDWSAKKVRKVLSEVDDLELQPEDCQSDFKVSFYYRDASEEQLNGLRRRLEDAGLRIEIIYSSKRDLDILPRGVNKGAAARFVAQELGYPRERVIVAGNSGNDATLFQQGFHGIIVSNADEELKRFAERRENYLSSSSHADGVREGLLYWMERIGQTS